LKQFFGSLPRLYKIIKEHTYHIITHWR